MLDDEKYVVFKRQDWNDFLDHVNRMDMVNKDTVHSLAHAQLGDATVIRCQDIFSAPALSAYADAITTTLEITDLFPREANGPVRTALLRSADFFRERAEEARGWPSKKLPD